MAVTTPKRIHIIGNCGSGKTYLAKKIARHLSVSVCDLDEIYWDNSNGQQGIEIPVDVRMQKLQNILQEPAWVIEGVYYKWLADSFAAADAIIIIEAPNLLRNTRLIKRFIQGRLGFIKAKKETLKSFIGLVKWAQLYPKEKLPAIIEMTETHKDKRHFFSSADDAFRFITTQSV